MRPRRPSKSPSRRPSPKSASSSPAPKAPKAAQAPEAKAAQAPEAASPDAALAAVLGMCPQTLPFVYVAFVLLAWLAFVTPAPAARAAASASASCQVADTGNVDYLLGGCVDYQFRMVTSGTTGLMFVLTLWGGLKWRTPLLMIFPYMAGRAVTALVQSAEMEVVVATPLLAVGYFWGHVTYSADPTMDVARMLLFCGVCWMAARAAVNSCGVSEDLAMAGAANISPVVALVLSWVSLYRNKSWLWFIDLVP